MKNITDQAINRKRLPGPKNNSKGNPVKLALTVILVITVMTARAGAETGQDSNTGSAPGKSGIVLIPVAFYTPETSVGLGGSAILFKKHCSCGKQDINNSLALVAFYTARNQFLTALTGNLYWRNAKYRYKPVIAISSFPLKFYGIGSDTRQDDEESYVQQYIKSENTLEARIPGPLYMGIMFIQGYSEIMSRDEDGLLDIYYINRRERGFYSGSGFTLRRDTRNNSLSPDRGNNTLFTAVFCNADIMGDYTFSRYFFDHRSYIPAFLGTTLAVQVLGDTVTGNPPLNYMPKLGGQNLMRGYYQGRYRDNIYFASQVELRMPVYKAFSAVLFGSAGNVFGRVKDITFRNPKYAGGFGMRFAVSKKERINFRVDIGISPSTEAAKGFEINPYFNILEAF